MSSPANLLGSLLSSSIVGGVTGWELKYGIVINDPDQLVVLSDSPSGQNPNPRWLLDYPMVQARIRGKPFAYNDAWAKGKEVQDALLGITSQDVGADRLVSVTCLSNLGLMGYDERNRPEFTVNFRIILEPAVGVHRDPL